MKIRYGFIFLFLILGRSGMAHEPLFGLGPHTIYKYGYALETEFEKGAEGWQNQLALLYGLTADWAITISFPYLFENPISGIGNIMFRTKYRFYRKDLRDASKQAAIHSGLFLPSQNATNTTDFFMGVSYGYESRRHYFFSGIRYRFNGTVQNIDRGDVFILDVAYGIRPWLLEYLQPDPVFLLELNGQNQGRFIKNKQQVKDSGGYVISLSPGLLFSYRNLMFKTGVKIPLINGLNGSKKLPNKEFVVAFEIHFPPLY